MMLNLSSSLCPNLYGANYFYLEVTQKKKKNGADWETWHSFFNTIKNWNNENFNTSPTTSVNKIFSVSHIKYI